MSVMDPMTMSAPGPAMDTSPVHRINSASSEGECESRSPVTVPGHSGESERPERMRDWLIRMINSNRFIGLEWLDKEKTIFKVPWIHAKKRGYCRERDAALFREWAIHSGKYRQDSDPTVWKINFRCAINGLKDIQEIKDMQTEDCRVYKVYPSRSRRRRRAVRRTAAEPYPNCNTTYSDMSSQHHLYSTYQSMNQYGLPSYPSNPVTSSADPMYPAVPYTPNVKLEYPNMCMQSSPYCMTGLSSSIPASTNGIYPTTPSHPTISTACSKQTPFYNDHIPPPIQTAPNLPAKVGYSPSSKVGFSRMDSPDSGINVESQNSPLMVQQNSPPQNSPMAHQQSSSPGPACSPPLQNHHSPLSTHSASPLSTVEQKPFSQPNNCSIGVASPLMSCNSPSGVSTSSPCPPGSVLSEPEPEDDNDDVQSIINSLEGSDTPTTPPISPQVPWGQVEVRVYYGTILAHTEYVDCSKGACRILSGPAYQSPAALKKVLSPHDQPLELPDNHPQSLSKDIFSAMGNGILVEVMEGSIYVTPLCRTIVYCSNLASPTQDAVQINKDTPTKVFDYHNHFRPTLEHYAILSGPNPSPSVFLGLGQSWGHGRTVTQNLVTIVVTHCKAKQDMDAIMLPPDILGGVDNISINIPDVHTVTAADMEAEEFLKNLHEISNA